MKEDKELKKQFVEILHKNGILEATKELKQSLFGSLYDAYNLDRAPTLPVGIKTAEELAMEGKQPFEMFPDLAEDIQYAACNWKVDMSTWSSLLEQINKVALIAYHAQFTPLSKSVGVEEAAKQYSDNTYSDPPFTAKAFIEGSNWQQQKQADTIVELREENERLKRCLTEIAADYDCHEDYLRMLAKEALKEKES